LSHDIPASQISAGFIPEGQIPVLSYHSIAECVEPRVQRFFLRPRDFRRHMAYLAENGYRTMTLSSLTDAWLPGGSLPEKSVVLTFDDGFADFYTEAVPALLEHNFTATLYVATGFMDGRSGWLTSQGEGSRPMLSWSMLQEVTALGFEVGSHSHSHPELDRCPNSTVFREITDSKTLLEDRLGVPVRTFAYPYGFWDRRVRDVVANAGFATAVQVAGLPYRRNDDSLAIPRIVVNRWTTESGLADLLAARSSGASRAVSTSKRLIWQALRRYAPMISRDPMEGAKSLPGAG